MDILRFQPLSSAVDTTFWAELQRIKLGELRLSERPLPLQGWLEFPVNAHRDPSLRIDQNSFLKGDQPLSNAQAVTGQLGTILNLNTLDSFKAFEAAAARKQVAQPTALKIWAAIRDGSALRDPLLLNRFVLLTFADLKRYHFTYWFGFIALEPPQPITSSPAVSLAEGLGQQAAQVAAACQGVGPDQPFWLLHLLPGKEPARHSLADWQQLLDAQSEANAATATGAGPGAGNEAGTGGEVILAWADPGSAGDHPAWPLRNALLAAAAAMQLRRLRVVCARGRGADISTSASLLLDVTLPDVPPGWCAGEGEAPKGRGWESQGRSTKPGPRQVDLAAALDPERLMDAAVDLNLKLMLWRAAPSLDLDALSATRCLLLGAGTLGCAVARTLLGWGVRHVTFLDSGRVSYSNPVRQSLFEVADCVGEGRPKAQAAADALRRIFPSVVTRGVQMMVPMAGHPIAASEEAAVRADTVALECLIRDHDTVFLLMDTREARWLPSLLCASAGKLAINGALGFDSYLVMRHGGPPLPPLEDADLGGGGNEEGAVVDTGAATPSPVMPPHRPPADAETPPGAGCSRVSCYFCQDVVAPGDSTVGRALDQQCTVARPGLAPIAAALAVEMMAAVVQEEATGSTEALGEAPHMLRGQLAGGEQTVLRGAAFPQCTACSATVVTALRDGGWPWLLAVLREPKRLEDLTGLTEMHAAMDLMEDFAVESDDEEGANTNSEEWTTL